MEDYTRLLEHLSSQKEVLLSYLNETETLCYCDLDAIPKHMQIRFVLQEKLDDIKKLLDLEYISFPRAKEVSSLKLDRSEIKPNEIAIFDIRIQIEGLIQKIMDTNKMLEERIKLQRDKAFKMVEETNKTNIKGVSGYSSMMNQGVNKPSRVRNKMI